MEGVSIAPGGLLVSPQRKSFMTTYDNFFFLPRVGLCL